MIFAARAFSALISDYRLRQAYAILTAYNTRIIYTIFDSTVLSQRCAPLSFSLNARRMDAALR